MRTSYELEVTGGAQKIMAVNADEKIGKYLNICPGDPVLKLDRKMETNRKDYFFYSTIFCNTNEFYLEGSF